MVLRLSTEPGEFMCKLGNSEVSPALVPVHQCRSKKAPDLPSRALKPSSNVQRSKSVRRRLFDPAARQPSGPRSIDRSAAPASKRVESPVSSPPVCVHPAAASEDPVSCKFKCRASQVRWCALGPVSQPQSPVVASRCFPDNTVTADHNLPVVFQVNAGREAVSSSRQRPPTTAGYVTK